LKRKPVKPVVLHPLEKFPVGTEVLIKRPHLWSGCVGVVVTEKEGMHRVRIEAKADGSTMSAFHTDATGDQLETWI